MLTGLKLKVNAAVGTASAGGLTTQPRSITGRMNNAVTGGVTGIIQRTSLNSGDTDVLNTHVLKTKRQSFIAASGLNAFRPEIVLGTRFEPVYDSAEPLLTEAGEMLNVQMAVRDVRMNNMISFVEKLSADEDTATIIDELSHMYTEQLTAIRDDVRFMADAYRIIDAVCRRLNICGNNDALRRIANDMLDDDGDVLDIRSLFVQRLGFSHAGFDAFTNTKIFGQLMFDMCNGVRRYTYKLFDIVDTDRLSDVDPIKYDRTIAQPTNRFTFDISNFGDQEDITNAFTVTTFGRFAESMPNAHVDKLKLLAVTLSRLYSASAALGANSVQADLRRLNVSTDVDDPFVDVIGIPGMTALDDIDDNNSVLGLTQINDQNIGVVLPFERRFIVNRHGRRFTPGDDYFFDGLVGSDTFDITRIIRFEGAFERRLTATMNIIEASTRVDTPYTRQQYGSRRHKLTAKTIHNDAVRLLADITTSIIGGGQRSKNYLFIVAVITMAQRDKHLKYLLFQLSFVATLHTLLSDNTVHFEFIDDMMRNELKTFGSLPMLANFTANIPVAEAGVFKEVNVGELRTAGSSTVAVGAAYRQLQKLVFDHVFNALSQHVHQQTYVAGVTTPVIQFDRPSADQTFDDDFAYIMTSVARLTDALEDEAGSQGSIGRFRKRAHLSRNRTGKSRYMNVSTSVRYLLSFELFTSLLSSVDIAKLGTLNVIDNSVTVLHVGSDILRKLTSTMMPSEGGMTSTDQHVNNFMTQLAVVNESLTLDLETIRSMTLNMRALTRMLDDAVDNMTAFFTSHGSDVARVFDGSDPRPARIGRRRRQTSRRPPQILRARRIGKRLNNEQRLARSALLTRQQLALAIVKLNDLSLSNVKASPNRRRQGTAPDAADIFVDGSRVTSGVKSALHSLMLDPRFRTKGHMKILSVAVPSGLAEQLADEIASAQNGDIDRETDVVVVNVHMRDMIENDVIFKPRSFVFELSRFVSAWSFDRQVETRAQKFSSVISDVNMFDASSFSIDTLRGQSHSELLVDQRYTFMSMSDVESMTENHLISYLLSVYIRMMTSIDVREEAFHIVNPADVVVDDSHTVALYAELAEKLVERSNSDMSLDELRGKFPAFNNMLTLLEAGELQTGVFEQQTIFDQITAAGLGVVLAHEVTDIAKLSTSRSTLTGGERLRHVVTSPKMFERVFNIAVDPFDFIIDVGRTCSTTSGKSAYDRLLRTDVITATPDVRLRRTQPGRSIVADQYFVTLSRYSPITRPRNAVLVSL
jgi:hypothetical protein